MYNDQICPETYPYAGKMAYLYWNTPWSLTSFHTQTHLECTVDYLEHGEKTNYSANPPGENTNPPGHISYSAQADYSAFPPGRLKHIPPVFRPGGIATNPPERNSSYSARAE